MVIKRKDGSVYKLVGPNPLMMDQEFTDIILHNFGSHETIVRKDPNLDIPELKKVEPKVDFKAEIETKKTVVEQQPDIKPAIVQQPIKFKPKLIQISCVAEQAFQPFLCEGLVLSNDDFLLTLWVNQELSLGSTIYPKNGEKRWWQIASCSKQEHGWKVTAKISTYQPAFLS